MEEIDLELRTAFLEDADELLAEAEAAFLRLEAGDDSDEIIGSIFRLAHSFKGSAKVVGFNELTLVAHKLEDVLTQVRKRTLKVDRNVCTAIFTTLDAIKNFVSTIKREPDHHLELAPIVTKLEALLTVKAPLPTVAPAKPAATTPLLPPSGAPSPPPSPQPPERAEEQTIRVSTRRLDQILNLVGEMVVNQSILSEHDANETLDREVAAQTRVYMDKLVKEAQRVAMSLRLVPVKPLFQKMRRAARDVAVLLGKDVEVVTLGEEAEIDKTVLEEIIDPLTHIIRNAIDHGIDSATERKTAGKPAQARVTLEAVQQEEQIVLKISDDGRGMDKERILAKAIARQLVPPGEQLTDKEIHALIFSPGFSTKEEITEISGRGVGLDVVQKAVSLLKGTLDVQTQVGKGTTFILTLPLSLSIIGGMVVVVDERKYVLPVSQLEETIELSKLKVETVTAKGRVTNLRGEVIPILSLSALLHGHTAHPATEPDGYSPAVIVLHHGKKVAFLVNDIVGQQQIVIKKLGAELRNLPGIVAGAILSTGEPGLILDLQELATRATINAS